MAAKIDQDSSSFVIADDIWRNMEILQSVKVLGFESDDNRKLFEKGERVLKVLEELDRKNNTNYRGIKREGEVVRRHKKPPNSIGGYLAQKIFCWRKVFINDEPKYTIWRIQ